MHEMKNNKHYLPEGMLGVRSPVKVVLVGAGGTGSQILSGLARINQALRALGGRGLDVTVIDGDQVAESNVGRQMYTPADIGKNKAVVSVTRLNMFFGTAWEAIPAMMTKDTNLYPKLHSGLLISAVDSGKTRMELGSYARNSKPFYWLDTGNTIDTGQAILGSVQRVRQPKPAFPDQLPTVLDLFPDIAEEDRKVYQGPSCSVRDALEKQDLFVNQWVATAALEILWKMFRHACVAIHGGFIDLKTMNARPLLVDREAWKRMGWAGRKSGPKTRKRKK